MAAAGEKRVKWATVPDAEFEMTTDDEIAAKYGCTAQAAQTERKKRKKLGRVVNGIMEIRQARMRGADTTAAAPLPATIPTQTPRPNDLPPRDTADPFVVFKHEGWGAVRTVMIDGEVWVVGKDVCDILGYTNPRDALANHVDPDDTLTSRIATPTGGFRGMTMINMTGVIALVASSKKPDAKKFQRWLFGEVVPSLMKYGAYAIGDAALTPKDEVEALLAQNDRLSNFIRAQHAKEREMDRVIALQAGEIAEKDGIIAERTSERDLYRDMSERVEESQHANYFAKQFHKNGIHLSAREMNKILVDRRIGAMKKIGGHKRFEPFIEFVNRGWYITHQYEYRPGKFRDDYELTTIGRQAVAEILTRHGYLIYGSPSDTSKKWTLF